MLDYTRYVGLDVHKDSIAVCVVTADGEEWPTSIIVNDPDVIAKTMRRIGRQAGGLGAVRCCYEAGPCGYTLYRQLTGMGLSCNVVAPGLTPVRPGNRVKTDRRDAKKLGRLERAGELTAVWVPDEAHEALRDLVRAREDAKEDLLRAGHRLGKFLLRHGKRPSEPMRRWTQKYERWLDSVHFQDNMQQIVLAEYRQQVREAREAMLRLEGQIELAVQCTPFRATVMALQALRGVALIVSATLVSEYGDMTRFTHPRQMMSYAGLTPSEASSGQTVRRGGITKMGNCHIRRVLVEAAWCYRHVPRVGRKLERRQEGQSPQIKSISWKAQVRLNQRYRWLVGHGKPRNQAVVAVARELVGFVWEVAWAVQGEGLAEVA